MIIDDGFMSEFLACRSVFIGGRKGSGKTLMAFELAEFLLKRGYRLVTNVTSVWGDDWGVYPEKVVFHVDEGGIYLRRASTLQVLANFLRKTSSYLIISGRKPPHRDLMELQLYVRFDLFYNMGIPVRFWKWVVDDPTRVYGGNLINIGWSKYYGIYDTIDPGENPGDIVDLAEAQAKTLFKKYGRSFRMGDVREKDGGDTISEMGEILQDFQGAISSLSREGKRLRSKVRK